MGACHVPPAGIDYLSPACFAEVSSDAGDLDQLRPQTLQVPWKGIPGHLVVVTNRARVTRVAEGKQDQSGRECLDRIIGRGEKGKILEAEQRQVLAHIRSSAIVVPRDANARS